MTSKPKAVIAFYGIDRRLDITAPSIFEQIIRPAQEVFEVQLMAHLWALPSIQNARSGEAGELASPRLALLPPGYYEVEPPLTLASEKGFQVLCRAGDFWQDDFKSLSNLYSQLVSLQCVTTMAMTEKPDCVIFVRPDLLYHDSLATTLQQAAQARDTVFLPHWQPHGGFNDRFAIACGEKAILAYGNRLNAAQAYCEATASPLHAEKLVKFVLAGQGIAVRKSSTRASRVRIDGQIKREDFSWHGWKPALRGWLGRLKRL